VIIGSRPLATFVPPGTAAGRRALALLTGAIAASLLLLSAPDARAGTRTINFDDAVGAPNGFAVTTPLTNRYTTALGVTFAGPATSLGGAILNESGNFGVTGHSAPNFLAFNTTTYAKGPETITFATPAHSVDINTGQSGGGTVTATAFDGTTPVSENFRTAQAALQKLSLRATRITSVRLSFTGSAVVFDDLVWGSAPISGDDAGEVIQNGRLDVGAPGVLSNDTDPDGDAFTASLVRQPPNGTVDLRSNGSYTYTPNTGFSGNDAFVYKASDGTGSGNESTVRIKVDPLPPPPPPPPPPPAPPVLKNFAVQLTFGFLPRHPKKTTNFFDFAAHNVPKGSTLVGRCVTTKGKKCKGRLGKAFTIKKATKKEVKLKGFLRTYPAGSILELTASKSGFNNQIKVTAVRRNKVPLVIATKCQAPGSNTRRNC
jgi:hypothetical protein